MQYKFTDLLNLKVEAPNEAIRKKILKNWDSIAKPLDGMGKFEALTAQIGAILGTEQLALDKKAVIIMCSDNGIVEEGISQCDQDVTRAVVEKMATQSSSVGKMATVMEIDTFPIDIGINFNEEIPGVLSRKVRAGTRNFMKEPAVGFITKELGLEPVIDGNMALGEGTGAVMMLGLLEMALKVYEERVTFSDMEIQQYERYETV